MTAFLRGLWVVAEIELRQRVRGVAWYVLIGLFAGLLLLVTVILAVALAPFSGGVSTAGSTIYSTVIYFVLLLCSLVVPALSGNSVNGDREAGTLATTQVTLITTPQLVLGKFLAAWLSAIAFLVVSIPFLGFSVLVGGVSADTAIVSVLVLLLELGLFSAAGVGLSGILRRPLFSVVVSYLLVALLSVGTLIGFGLGSIAVQTHATFGDSYRDGITCHVDPSYEHSIPRPDLVWWMLAANPYVVMADASPTHYTSNGNTPDDLFGFIKLGVRSAQLAPQLEPDPTCSRDAYPGARQIIDSTVPSWIVGLLIHLAIAAAALWGAIALTRAPSRRLAAGSRVA